VNVEPADMPLSKQLELPDLLALSVAESVPQTSVSALIFLATKDRTDITTSVQRHSQQ